jgi:hypothetical protein
VSLRPHRRKQIDAEQQEVYDNDKLLLTDVMRQRRKAKQRHVNLKLISGSAAGVPHLLPI